MFWLFQDSTPWFRAKRYGLGAGLPIAWQGWALVAAHVGLVLGVAQLLQDRPLLLLAIAIPAALLPLPIYAARTEGGWRWRWGGDQ
jgi:hypothetical protein